MQKIFRMVKWMVILYLLFAIIASTIPWLPQLSGRMDAAAETPPSPSFTGDGEGPDRVTLIEDPSDAFAVRVAMVRGAEKSLDIVYYAIRADEAGRAFLGEVLRAADRGVSIRILVDGTINATGQTARNLKALETHPNIICRRYNPIHLLKPWTWHALMHDKLILADDTHLLSGGRNIDNRFFDLSSHVGAITYDRDVFVTGVGVPGSVVPDVRAYIGRLWDHAATQAYRPADKPRPVLDALLADAARAEADNAACYASAHLPDYLQRTLPTRKITLITNPIHTGKKAPLIGGALRKLSEEAEHSVIIQTPYATANRTFLGALSVIDAGAETILLTNSAASTPNIMAFSNYYTTRSKFLATGIDLFELQSTDSMHGKSLVIDHHLSVVGSLNLDDRSLFIDTENMLVIDSEPFAAAMRTSMNVFMRNSLQVLFDGAYADGYIPALPVSLGKRAKLVLTAVLSRTIQFLI